jgi:4-amino-4-deoxy-L-arabinose transferase-like glycosyltransferase
MEEMKDSTLKKILQWVKKENHPTLRVDSWKLWIPLAVGLCVRLILLLSAGDIRPVYDEIAYVRLAKALISTGEYHSYWPPGYPGLMAISMWCFGKGGGLFAFRLFQVFFSSLIGLGIIQISHLLFNRRGALVSGYAWAFYLPLAAYSHRLFPETLYLGLFVFSMYLLICYLRGETKSKISLIVAGILFGLGLYLKESAVGLQVLIVGLLLYAFPRRWASILLFPLAIILVLLPLTIRNYQYYDRFVLVGATMDVNIHKGLNRRYYNHDYNPWMGQVVDRAHKNKDNTYDFIYRTFIDYGPGWKHSRKENLIDKTREDLKTALDYALDHKKAFVLTRIKKMADFFTPLSFLVRDFKKKIYSGVIKSPAMSRPLIVMSLAMVLIMLPVSLVNLIRLREDKFVFLFFLAIAFYFMATGLLVSMSRYRMPIVPFLLVLVGGTTVLHSKKNRLAVTVAASVVCIAVLVSLWYLNLSEVTDIVVGSWTPDKVQ